jgi:hypothetical protein
LDLEVPFLLFGRAPHEVLKWLTGLWPYSHSEGIVQHAYYYIRWDVGCWNNLPQQQPRFRLRNEVLSPGKTSLIRRLDGTGHSAEIIPDRINGAPLQDLLGRFRIQL